MDELIQAAQAGNYFAECALVLSGYCPRCYQRSLTRVAPQSVVEIPTICSSCGKRWAHECSPTGLGADMVTQAELLAHNNASLLHASLRPARARIVQMLDDGVPVQPGPLQCRVQVSHSRHLSRAFVATVLGEQTAKMLVERCPPQESRSLIISPSALRTLTAIGMQSFPDRSSVASTATMAGFFQGRTNG